MSGYQLRVLYDTSAAAVSESDPDSYRFGHASVQLISPEDDPQSSKVFGFYSSGDGTTVTGDSYYLLDDSSKLQQSGILISAPVEITAEQYLSALEFITELQTYRASRESTEYYGVLELNGQINCAGFVEQVLKVVGHFSGASSVFPDDIFNAISYAPNPQTIVASDGAWGSIVVGGVANDSIAGYGGNDLLYGGLGADALEGGSGDDVILGGAGNDHLAGNAGADYLAGGGGDDALNGGADTDTLVGGAGNDWLGYTAADELAVSADDYNSNGNTYEGGTGNDRIFGSTSGDTIRFSSGDGTDIVHLNGGADIVQLTDLSIADAETRIDKVNSDLVLVFGDDSIVLKEWFASVDKGLLGVQEARGYTGASALEGLIDRFVSSIHGIQIDGNGWDNDIISLAGGARLQGGAGFDTYHTSNGDTINDANASGRIVIGGVQMTGGTYAATSETGVQTYVNTDGSVVYNWDATTGILAITAGTATVTVENFNASVSGFGTGVLHSGLSLDLVRPVGMPVLSVLTAGSNYFQQQPTKAVEVHALGGADQVYGSNLHDLIFGGEGNDWLYGNPGNDRLYGGVGQDRLYGGTGSDILQGDDGADVLEGGGGADILNGGLGADLYYFTYGYGIDTVIETGSDYDTIRFGANINNTGNVGFARVGDDLRINTYGASDMVYVKDWFLGADHEVERVEFQSNNSVYTAAQINGWFGSAPQGLSGEPAGAPEFLALDYALAPEAFAEPADLSAEELGLHQPELELVGAPPLSGDWLLA